MAEVEGRTLPLIRHRAGSAYIALTVRPLCFLILAAKRTSAVSGGPRSIQLHARSAHALSTARQPECTSSVRAIAIAIILDNVSLDAVDLRRKQALGHGLRVLETRMNESEPPP